MYEKRGVWIVVTLFLVLLGLGFLAFFSETRGITGAVLGVQPVEEVASAIEVTIPQPSAEPTENVSPSTDSETVTAPHSNISEENTAKPAAALGESSPTVSEEQPKSSSGSLAPATIGITAEATSTTCGTVSANLNIAANITFSTDSDINACLNVTASNIIINGTGFAIISNGTGYGINISGGVQNVTIKNLLILNFTRGIYVSRGSSLSTNHTFFNNTITPANISTTYGILMGFVARNNISLNTITINGDSSYGLVFQPSVNNTIFSNNITMTGSTDIGFWITWAGDPDTSSANNTFISNKIRAYGSSSTGVDLRHNQNSNFSFNEIVITGLSGIGLSFAGTTPSTNISFLWNNVTAGTGVEIADSGNITIGLNNFTTPPGVVDHAYGAVFRATGSGMLVTDILLFANDFTLSTNATNDMYGLRIIRGTFGINSSYNDFSLSGGVGYGMYFGQSENNSISFNNLTVSNSTNLGIYLSMGIPGLPGAESPASSYNNVSKNRITTPDATAVIIFSGNNFFSENNITGSQTGFVVSGNSSIFEKNALFNNSVAYSFINRTSFNNFTLEKISNSSTAGILISSSSANGCGTNIFRDSTFANNTLDLSLVLGQDCNITFINSSVTKNKLSVYAGGKAYVKWYIVANVTTPNSLAIPNATVTALNSLSDVEDAQSTDSGGRARLEVTEFYKTNQINYFITPSTVLAKKNNYTHNQTSIDLTNSTGGAVNLSLTEITCGSSIFADVDFGNNFTCVGLAFTIGANNLVINGTNITITGNGGSIGFNVSGRNNITIIGATIWNFTNGIYLELSNASQIKNVKIINNSRGLVFNSSNNNNVWDSTFANNSVHSIFAVNDGGTNNSLINVSILLDNITVSGTAVVFLKWYVTVNATYNGSLPLPNANVSGFFNDTQSLEDSVTTGSNGLGRLTLTELKKNSSGITYKTPHNITLSFASVSGSGINFTYVNLTVNNNTDVNLSLTLNCTVPVSGANALTSSTTFCPGTFSTTGAVAVSFDANNIVLTCDQTVLKSSSSEQGFTMSRVKNITAIGCTLKNYRYYGVFLSGSSNITLINLNVSSDTSSPYNGVYCQDSPALTINHSRFSNPNSDTVFIEQISCNNSFLFNNTLTGTTGTGIELKSSHNAVVKNNTFKGLATAIALRSADTLYLHAFSGAITAIYYQTSSNNSFFYNNFSGNSFNYIYTNTTPITETNFFNTTTSSGPQGNAYSDYCDKGSDTGSDGYADTGQNATEWPYSANISSKITDAVANNGGIIDYGPRIISCAASDVFLGSSGGGATTATTAAPAAAAAAPAPPAGFITEQQVRAEEFFSPEETKRFLTTEKKEVTSSGGVTRVTVLLKNTGEKKMLFSPEIFQEIEDPFFIITKKTVAFEGSFFDWMTGISLSKDKIAERLLKATIQNPEEIVLNPGETIEKTIELREGLVSPRQIKIKFTTFGETVFEQEIEKKREVVSGTAIDVDSQNNHIDIYAVIVPEMLSKKTNEPSSPGLPMVTAGVVVSPVSTEKDNYYLELNLNKKETARSTKRMAYTDLYGPYTIREDRPLVFAQQFSYNPALYKGAYSFEMKVYRADHIVVENAFDILLE